MKTKKCDVCNEERKLSDFYNWFLGDTYADNTCKYCAEKYEKEWKESEQYNPLNYI